MARGEKERTRGSGKLSLVIKPLDQAGEGVWMRAGGGGGGKRGKMGEGGEREWLGCYYSSQRIRTQSAARREAHCAAV